MTDMEIVIETLEGLADAAYRDMKANQGIGDDPGGHWSSRTDAAIQRARALIAALRWEKESVDAARDGVEREARNEPPPLTSGEIEPCPFCGGQPTLHDTAEAVENAGSGDYFWMCDCGIVTTVYAEEAEAIAAWNRRTPPSTAGWLPISTAPWTLEELALLGGLLEQMQKAAASLRRYPDAPQQNREHHERKLASVFRLVFAMMTGTPAPSQEGASEGEGSPSEDAGPV